MPKAQKVAFYVLVFVALCVAAGASPPFEAEALQVATWSGDFLLAGPTAQIDLHFRPPALLGRSHLLLSNNVELARHLSDPNVIALASTAPNNVACTSNVVIDYNADPTGTNDSTLAFQMAVNATPRPGAAPGNIVCVPPGRYMIGTSAVASPHDITIYTPASANGGAILGPIHGVATIVQNDLTSNIIDSCLTGLGAISSIPNPQVCSSVGAVANNVINGWRLSNLTLTC